MRSSNALAALISAAFFAWLLVFSTGCAQSAGPSSGERWSAADSAPASARADRDISLTPTEAPQEAAKAGAEGAPGERPAVERKIIYNATLDLTVEDFDPVAAAVEALVRKYDGFIAKSSLSASPGSPRSGAWTVRIPTGRYEEFLAAAGSLGELRRRTADSREVTAEYYDLETRIRNKQLEEKRLLEHLEDSTGKLEDILAVEREISRVRTEVEQMQGQLRVLTDLTALSTVTLNIHEVQGYKPEESPTFATQIRRTWDQSVEGLLQAGRLTVLAIVAIAPWLLVLAIPLVIAILMLRWVLRWLLQRLG